MAKDSTKAALDRFFAKDAKRREREMGTGQPKTPRGRPEFEQTVKPCWKWLEANGFSMSIVESRAVYNAEAGRFVDGQAEAGFPDSVGCCPDGTGAFVEFKAPGKRSTVRPGQYEFLKAKLELGCFAVVADSVESLANQWREYSHLRAMNRQLAINFLRRQLPEPRVLRQQAPDANDLPF